MSEGLWSACMLYHIFFNFIYLIWINSL